jgi:hypothetical protein
LSWGRTQASSTAIWLPAPQAAATTARRTPAAPSRQLGRFTIPFSGIAERGAITPAGRQLAALCELLERGVQFISVRNIDNTAAVHDHRWLSAFGYLLNENADMLVEVAQRPQGQKGAH